MKLWRIGRCRLALGLTVVAILAIACGDDDEAPAVMAAATRTATSALTPSSTAQPAATSTSATTPPPTSTIPPTATEPPRESTGVPAVDRIISAVLGGDLVAVEALVQLRSVACGAQGVGSPPPCPAGEPAGTMVQVLPVATCEGEWRPASAVRPSFQPLVSANPRLYAVYGMPEQFQQRIPDGQYVAVFSRDAGNQGELGAGVVIAGNRIAGLWFGCGAKADQIVPAGTSTILPPRA